MSGDSWNSKRVRMTPLHRKIEALCLAHVTKRGRTWSRIPYADRCAIVEAVTAHLSPEDLECWTESYGVGDVLNPTVMPERYSHKKATVKV